MLVITRGYPAVSTALKAAKTFSGPLENMCLSQLSGLCFGQETALNFIAAVGHFLMLIKYPWRILTVLLWCAMDPIKINPSHVRIYFSQHHGSYVFDMLCWSIFTMDFDDFATPTGCGISQGSAFGASALVYPSRMSGLRKPRISTIVVAMNQASNNGDLRWDTLW